MAYASNETGIMEVYVSPFPSGNGKWQVSSGGCQEPRWRQDGKELIYLSAEGKMTAVAVKTGISFEGGPLVALFQTHPRQPVAFSEAFSFACNGARKKVLLITRDDQT